jgi:hypothetical protein
MVAAIALDYTNDISAVIDWSAGKVFTTGTAPREQARKKYPVTCACGQVRWLTASDARRAGDCFRCAQRRKAAMGYEAMVARYGEKWAVHHLQAYRLEHPSSLEQAVMLTLSDLHVSYRREVWLATKASGRKQRVYLVDFIVTVRGIDYAIEVNGEWAHRHHARRDQLKLRLLRRRGYPVLVLTEADIRAGRTESLLKAFLDLDIPGQMVPKRGCYIKRGDVVSPRPGEAYRVLHIEEDGPLTCEGVWLDLRAPADLPPWRHKSRFNLHQLKWYTTFEQGVAHV